MARCLCIVHPHEGHGVCGVWQHTATVSYQCLCPSPSARTLPPLLRDAFDGSLDTLRALVDESNDAAAHMESVARRVGGSEAGQYRTRAAHYREAAQVACGALLVLTRLAARFPNLAGDT